MSGPTSHTPPHIRAQEIAEYNDIRSKGSVNHAATVVDADQAARVAAEIAAREENASAANKVWGDTVRRSEIGARYKGRGSN